MRKAMELISWDKDDMFNCSPVVKCEIDGIRTTLLLDSGASISFLDQNFIKKHPNLQKKVKKGKYSYTVDSISGSKKITKTLAIENLTLLSSEFSQEFKVADLNLPLLNRQPAYDGVLGFDFLVQNKITLNFKDFIIAD